MTSSILMVAFLSIPTFLSFTALRRLSGMQKAAAAVCAAGSTVNQSATFNFVAILT
jgi:hypothetical protein